jgi:proliferating cell nuclear antigen
MNIDPNDCIFFLQTLQSNPFKVLLDSLKDILDDVTIDINEDGLILIEMDGTHTVMVHLKLNADKGDGKGFEEYHYNHDEKNYRISLKIPFMYKMLKTISTGDILTLALLKEDDTKLIMVIENENKNLKDISKLKLRDVESPQYEIPNPEYKSVSRISSNEFQKYCRDMSIISDSIIFKIEDDKFTLSADGDFGEKEIILGEMEDSLMFNKKTSEIIKAKFSLPHLSLFARSSNLCSELQIYLNTDNPLILLYPISNLGSLKYLLAPMVDDDNINTLNNL